MTGPFIVRHYTVPEHDGATGAVLSVKAVADFADAQQEALELVGAAYGDRAYDEAWDIAVEGVLGLTDAGGRVVLPDGSVVEVEATSWPRLAGEVADGAYLPEPMLLERWNAEHGVEAQSEGVTADGGLA